jgi:hypothetical protein
MALVTATEPTLRGFDCNRPLTAAIAREAILKKYRFVMRYIRRDPVNSYDLSPAELRTIVEAGLGCGVVQHVAAEDEWRPSRELGKQYGGTAAKDAQRIGIPTGASVFCDLEGVHPDLLHAPNVIIAYANAWYDEVRLHGYVPALYVGWHSGLTPQQLYANLKFSQYWGGYNLDRDLEPAVRGLSMKQYVAKPSELLTGFTAQTMDTDIVTRDRKGGTPFFTML